MLSYVIFECQMLDPVWCAALSTESARLPVVTSLLHFCDFRKFCTKPDSSLFLHGLCPWEENIFVFRLFTLLSGIVPMLLNGLRNIDVIFFLVNFWYLIELGCLGRFRDVVVKVWSRSSLFLLGFSSRAILDLLQCLANTDYKKLVVLQDESQVLYRADLDDHSSDFWSLVLNKLLNEWV